MFVYFLMYSSHYINVKDALSDICPMLCMMCNNSRLEAIWQQILHTSFLISSRNSGLEVSEKAVMLTVEKRVCYGSEWVHM